MILLERLFKWQQKKKMMAHAQFKGMRAHVCAKLHVRMRMFSRTTHLIAAG